MGCSLSRHISYDLSPDSAILCGECRPWEHVFSTSIVEWNSSEAKLWKFAMDVGVPGNKYNNPLQPWSTHTQRYDVLLPAPVEQVDLDVKYSHDAVQVS